MDDQKPERQSDELELSDVDAQPLPRVVIAGRGPRSARHAWRAARFTPRRGLRLLGALSAIALALLAILSSNPVLGAGANQLAFGWLPTPSPTLGLNDQSYYLLPNVPWGTVLLDGRPLARIPVAGDPHPLHLALGQHQFEWLAAPFTPLHCVVWVPNEFRDACWATDATQQATLNPFPTASGWVIPVNESLATLPDNQHAMLVSAAQSALAARHDQAIVPRGQLYALTSTGTAELPVPASTPLLATLAFHLLADFGIHEPCSGSDLRIDPCRFPGQDCSEFCTVNLPTTATSPWTVAAIAWLSWDYATLQGREVARGQGDPGLNFRLIVLRITWANGAWQVTPAFGHQAGVPSADDSVCAAARAWLARGPLANLLPDGNAFTSIQYFSGPAPAAGCAVVLAPHQAIALIAGAAGPNPLFLVRFGVLVAANHAAHALWPTLPLADAEEVDAALRLADQAAPP
jgi:hypothetical protein